VGFHVTETIDCSSELVWAVVTDWSKAGYWLGVDGLKPAGKGKVGKGTQLAFTARGAVHTTRISRWEPNRALTLESVQGGVTVVYAYTLWEEDGATKVELQAECSAAGWFWKLLLPMIAFFMARADAGQLKALKQLALAQVADANRKADKLA
jgi:hypothetical protein